MLSTRHAEKDRGVGRGRARAGAVVMLVSSPGARCEARPSRPGRTMRGDAGEQ